MATVKKTCAISVTLTLLTAALTASGESWRFVVTGDSRGGGSGADEVNTVILGEMAAAMAAEAPDFVAFSGDLVQGYPATQAAFELWTNAMSPVYDAGIPVLVVRGNHDLGAGWVEVFGEDLPDNGPPGEIDLTYWYTNKNCLIVALDNYTPNHRVNQDWLDAVLASDSLPHVFVFGHEPAFSVRHEDCLDDYPAERDAFWNSLADAGAKFYFCGHDHFYDHMRLDDGDGNITNDLHQMVIGSAGAPLYVDSLYDGDNSMWTPVRHFHEKQYGYVLVTVSEDLVTLEWKHRVSAGVYTTAETFTYSAIGEFRASRPYPEDGTITAPVDADLSWRSIGSVLSHDVYLGTGELSVASATTNSEAFMANQSGNTYDPGLMDYLETYYWRIDEHLASGSVLTGYVWRFTTKALPDHHAADPYPADGALNVPAEADLAWTAGGDAVLHHVFLGTNRAAVAGADYSSPRYRGSSPAAAYDPGMLDYLVSYYWRIDEELSDGNVVTGGVWSFTVKPVPGQIFVATDGLNIPPYTNWTDAARTIAAAVAEATDGDTVVVGTGIYNLSATLAITNGITVRSAYGRADTVIDGGDSVRCLYLSHEDAVVSGFTVRNGRALIAGGVFIEFAGTLENCLVEDCVSTSDDAGGVLCSWGGLVRDCEIAGNSSGDDGGGVACKDGGKVENCIVRGNLATDKGGGVYLSGGSVWGSLIFDNESISPTDGGGGVYTKEGGEVRNCTITANRASGTAGEGGGIWFGDIATVMNSIVYYNSGSLDATRNLGGNVQGVSYTCTTPDPSGVEIITDPPQFTDPRLNNYRVKSTSPCIDRGGDLAGVGADLDGVARPLDGNNDGKPALDIGAYEFVHSAADTDGDGLSDVYEVQGDLDPTIGAGADGPDGDPDGDGMSNSEEQTADTHPNDSNSVLRLTEIRALADELRLGWQGGRSAWQFLEYRADIVSTSAGWDVIFSNAPPTSVTTNVNLGGMTNKIHFYRLRVTR